MLPTSSLITKLSKREKFFFNKHNEGKTTKTFHLLYKYLESNPNATFQDLKSNFQNTTVGNNLSVELNHLQKRILRSLHIFRLNNKSIQNIILKNISYARILNEKKETKNAIKLIRQTKKLGYKYEEFSLLNQLIILEEEIGYDTVDSSIHKALFNLNLEKEVVTKLINELNILKRLKNRIIELQYIENNFIYDSSKYPDLFQSPYLNLENYDRSSKGKDYFYLYKSIALSLLGKTKQSLKYNKLKYENVKANQHIFTKVDELKSMNNILFHYILLRDEINFKKEFKIFESYKDEPNLSQELYAYFNAYLQLRFEIEVYNIDNLKLLTPYVTEILQTMNFNPTQLNLLYHYLIGSLIIIKDIDKAQDALIKWDRVKKIPYVENAARIARLIIYKEQNNITLLKNELSNFKKALKIKNELTDLLFKYFNSHIKGYDSMTGSELLERFQILSQKKQLKKYFIEFYFISWAKSIK